ncbi:hypothetical protein IscW_ISCW022428 [Ixodes scapularis]|uniref:Mutator-like transposase domain-containing protein n=1 Tax=Ixodes scapularis TaxID=6945 RepID=B7QDM2_IXOSC|nr:hypothetical protein IscW_ISCW022428 [Ixodes scapularis]|eukprot:XP_002413636.1 hypothetical protein IscW_ISCW022428 [Ixodes scapularis]
MEVEAAGFLFSRSEELHRMQYTIVLSDGDSKSFLHVPKLNLYNKEIVKEECVNHKKTQRTPLCPVTAPIMEILTARLLRMSP